jgi:non-ribosomal peptide synthetase-like protein
MTTVDIGRVDPEEQDTILQEWCGSAFDPQLAGPGLLHEIFEEQVDAHPDRVALVCQKQEQTYRQLEQGANRLARYLRSRGVTRGDKVAMLLPRSCSVHMSILGILKAGAAYVPLDCDCPAERVSFILGDCHIRTIVTTDSLARAHRLDGMDVILLDQQESFLSDEPDGRLARAETGTTTEDLCYIIYTSGSTGKPKGVQITHANACNLVCAERRIFRVQPEDRVFQGFSIAFDASVEEIWLALSGGATLVVGTSDMVHAGPGLSALLSRMRVSVLSCVPTLLSMMHEDIPGLRLLILGGEQCPQDLLRRWCRPGRRVVNTYGPTEATVIATFADCHPDKPVTIGRPVPNYRVHILDSNQQPLPVGVAGEIYIGGSGVAMGYVGRGDLTAERFLADPFAEIPGQRLYRTGDLGQYNQDGEIEFLGRADSQVKLRGFRIELSEIESALMQCPCVQAAAVTVREDVAGIRQLVGYVVCAEGAVLDEEAVRAHLRRCVPAYMVPTLLQPLSQLPLLPSGKVDRKNLPPPAIRTVRPGANRNPPRTALEKKIASVWQDLLASSIVSRDTDFFQDLGGHSLLAARMVSQLRADPDFHDLSILDVYRHPVLHVLAAACEARRGSESSPGRVRRQTSGMPLAGAAYRICAVAQAVGLYLLTALAGLEWLVPYLIYEAAMSRGIGFWSAVMLSVAARPGLYPLQLLLAIVIKWTVIGRYKPGRYPLWSIYYLRWWFVNRVLSQVSTHYLLGTPLLNIYYRLMGADIGENVFLGTDHFGSFDLVHVGDDSSVGLEASLSGYTVEGGMLRIGSINIGKRCFLGTRAMMRPDSRMEDDARLENLSLLPDGATLPRGQTWSGSPAFPAASKDGACACRQPVRNHPSPARRLFCVLLHALGIFVLQMAYVAAALPGALLVVWASHRYGGCWFLLLSAPAAILYVLSLLLMIAALKWLLLGKVAPGQYPVGSWFYIRKWCVDQLMDTSLVVLGPVYATLYVIPWYRLLGVRLGKRAEVSTAHSIPLDLLSIGEESFIADSVSLGAAHIDGGVVTLAHTRVGRRSFVGNSATIPPDCELGDGSLIGVMTRPPSVPPHGDGSRVAAGTSWLGSPPVLLPRRQSSAPFPDSTTFRPARRLYLLRLFVEFFRITLPPTFVVLLNSLLVLGIVLVSRRVSTMVLLSVVPAMDLACGIVAAGIVIATKWILMRRYRPVQQPLWSLFVWRTELLTALHEGLADPLLIRYLLGTPFAPWFFRLLGSKIGKQVYMETTSLTEFDLIDLGDGAALNQDCVMQTHLFEDRVMKMSTIHVGAGCSVGARSIVLYDGTMQDGSALSDLSLVMKGETLPAGTRWVGTPSHMEMPPAGG